MLSPVAGLVGAAAFALTFYTKRIVSLASLVGLMTASAVHLVLHPIGAYLWMGGAIVFMILIRHESNIDALLHGSENAFR